MSNYGVHIDGMALSQMPCMYLSHIIDVKKQGRVSYQDIQRWNNLVGSIGNEAAFMCLKFNGTNYHAKSTGIQINPWFNVSSNQYVNGLYQYDFCSFWDFKIYIYRQVKKSNLSGYGVVINDENESPIYINANDGDYFSYAQDFRVGDAGAGRLYFSQYYRYEGQRQHFFASSNGGALVRASCMFGNVTPTHYEVPTEIFSIKPPTAAEEQNLKNAGRYITLR